MPLRYSFCVFPRLFRPIVGCVLFLGIAGGMTNVWARDDFQTRQLVTLKMIDTKKIDLSLFNQLRMVHDAEDINFYQISPQLKYDAFEHVAFGLNYSYVRLKSFNPAVGRNEFKTHHRCELEVDPHWSVGDWLDIQTINRYEFRWIEDQGSHNPRFRHKTNLEFPQKDRGPVKSVYMYSEFFYDINDHRYNENWTVPFGVKFKINPKASVGVFYMIQSRLSDTWTSAQVLGTHIFVKF